MRKGILAIASVLLFFPGVVFAGNLKIVPSTTLQALTSNNTSAADNFTTQSNGNAGAANISKLDIHSLLYPGARTKVIAHLMPWFGDKRHMQVGYLSWDPAQIHRQVTDMISRGVDGLIIDWYGPADDTNVTALRVMDEVEKHPGFTFAIMVDKGAIQLRPCLRCTPQETLDLLLQYVEQKFISSPSYMRIDGRPVVTNFDVELHFPVDWKAAVATMTSNPIMIFEDANGFTHTVTDGSYSWVRPSTHDFGMSYMNKFYEAGLAHPRMHTLGAAYKGFNDTRASWGLDRIMGQQCGATWLQTFVKINSLYNSTNQLEMLQLPTWNDYEEATEVESGIDNCLSVSAKMSGKSLQWSLSGKGSEDTVDHYQVYISADGKNLMPLERVETGVHSLNVCSFSPANGKYSLFVQAVGKPTIRNQISSRVEFQSTCAGATVNIHVGATPAALTMKWGSIVASKVTVVPISGSFGDVVALSCSGLPAGVDCMFSPSHVVPGSGGVVSTLTLSSNQLVSQNTRGPEPKGNLGMIFLFPGLGIAGLTIVGGDGTSKRIRRLFTVAILAIMVTCLASCGAASGSGSALNAPNGIFNIAVNGDSGSQHASAMLTLVIKR
jgi:hypothetical protein